MKFWYNPPPPQLICKVQPPDFAVKMNIFHPYLNRL
jgi:hypothetical protein